MGNRIRAVVVGALIVATGACATAKPQEPMAEAMTVLRADDVARAVDRAIR